MKYKIGDKVRILDGRSSRDELTPWTPGMTKAIGTIGTVLCIDEWDNTVLVSIGDMESYWIKSNWLATVEENQKAPSKSGLLASLLVTLDDVAKNPKPYPKHIYKGEGKTVVMWEDGTKTIVKRAEGEPDNDYAAFTAALAIKIYGDNSKVNRIVRMTETVEKRKKKKKQKEDAEGKFEVTRLAGKENKFESTGVTFSNRKDAEGFVDIINTEPDLAGKYFVREKGEE